MKIIKLIVFLSFIAALASSCSNFRRYDDAVRIKSEASDEYLKNSEGDIRNSSALKGTAVEIVIVETPKSCPIDADTKFESDTTLVFLDENAAVEPQNFEAIPLEHIELPRSLYEMPENAYSNANVFENYNSPEKLRKLREIPVIFELNDTCDVCDCKPWRMRLSADLKPIEIKCIDREFQRIFVEMRGGYAVYADKSSTNEEISRDSYPVEIAAGARLGPNYEYGLGLAVASGIKTHNQFKNQDYARPILMLHGRYQSPNDRLWGLCMRPFAYGQFGLSLDELSMSLWEFKFGKKCSNCKEYIQTQLTDDADLNFGMPLSFGLGIGLDIPITKFMDLSIDAGARSIGFGESARVYGFDNVPSLRRVNMFIFRFGFTF